jgi:hypothetical protein
MLVSSFLYLRNFLDWLSGPFAVARPFFPHMFTGNYVFTPYRVNFTSRTTTAVLSVTSHLISLPTSAHPTSIRSGTIWRQTWHEALATGQTGPTSGHAAARLLAEANKYHRPTMPMQA